MADDGTAEAKRLIAERRYADAIVVCRRLLLLGPDRSEVRVLLGEALLAEERWDEVRVEMLALIRRTPNEAIAHRLLGEAFLRDGQPEKAKEPLARAVELAPDDPIAKELAEEAVEEPFRDAHTIERWFADEEPRTVETSLPAFEEESTPVPALAPPTPVGDAEPSIQIDPSLAEELARLEGMDSADVTQPLPPSAAQAAGLKSLLSGATSRAAPKPGAGAGQPKRTLIGIASPIAPKTPTVETPEPAAPKATFVPPPASAAPRPLSSAPAKGGFAVPKPGGPSAAKGATAVARPGATPKPGPAPAPIVPPVERAEPPPPEDEPNTAEIPLSPIDEETDADDALTMRLPPIAGPPSSPPRAPDAGNARLPTVPPVAPPPRMGSGLPASPMSARPSAGVPVPASAFSPPRSAQSFPAPAPPPPQVGQRGIPTPALPPLSPVAPVAHPVMAMPAASSPPAAPVRPFLGGGPTSSVEPATKPKIRTPADAVWVSLGLHDPARRLVAAVGAGVFGVGLVLIVGWLACAGDGGRGEAVRVASTYGRPASYEAALFLLPAEDGGEVAATRARVLASSSLELGIDHFAEADALLGALDAESGAGAEARVARALVAIGRGQPEQALTFLSGLEATDVTLVEAFRARALALAALGQASEALDAARQAATLAPEAPRHAALLGSLALAAGDAAMALRSLGDATRATPLRVVRAEVDLADGGDASIAAADVEAVLAAPDVTGPERARASITRARLALAAGNTAGALADLATAEPMIPVWDEPRRVSAAELLLAMNEAARARALLDALPVASGNPRVRAELGVRASLALGDIPAAERAVGLAGTGPNIDFLRARIAEAGHRLDEARALYASAAADPALLVAARTAEGAILYAQGSMPEASAALASALGGDPSDGRAVLLYTRASIAAGDRAGADRAVRAAMALHPERAEIVAASGLVALAGGHPDEAATALASAVAVMPTDLELALDLAVAQWRLGRLDEASTTLSTVLTASATNVRALTLSFELALERARFDEAQALVSRLGGAGASVPDVARRTAELAAARGLGRTAIDETERAANRIRDAGIWIALARLQIQAEDDRDARRTLTRARRYDRDHPVIDLLSAILDAHSGARASAGRSVEDAEREATRRGATPSLLAFARAVRGRTRFEASDMDEARRLGEEAVALDPLCAEAHLLLADVATVGSSDPIPSLRSAAAGTYPMPEALGRLAIRLRSGDDACSFARLYDERAHGGYDQDDVDDILEGCR